MRKGYTLSAIDKKILGILQDDARIKYSDLAKAINKPVSTVFERIKRLEAEEIIEGYHTVLNSEKVGKSFTAFVLGQAKLGKDINLDAVGEALSNVPEVLEVHFVTGDYDFLVKMKVKDQKEYYEVVQDVARNFGERGKGMFAPKTFKESTSFVFD